MNYDLPFNIKQFYNAPIWPNIFDDRKRRAIEMQKLNSSIDLDEHHLNNIYNSSSYEDMKYSSDFTAGELYQSFENLLLR